MDKTLKDCIQDYYFQNNYNCAEAMIHAGNDYYGLGISENDMRMVAGYGAGLQCGQTCGAIISAVSLLSMRYVAKNAHSSPDITITSNMLIKRFKDKYDSLLCKDIRPKSFQKEIRCLNTINFACDTLEEVIREYDSKKGK